jgi:hypothetical protein
MVLAEDVTDDGRGFLVGSAGSARETMTLIE